LSLDIVDGLYQLPLPWRHEYQSLLKTLPGEESLLHLQKINVAAASLFIASRGGASPQKFEKRALTTFRLES